MNITKTADALPAIPPLEGELQRHDEDTHIVMLIRSIMPEDSEDYRPYLGIRRVDGLNVTLRREKDYCHAEVEGQGRRMVLETMSENNLTCITRAANFEIAEVLDRQKEIVASRLAIRDPKTGAAQYTLDQKRVAKGVYDLQLLRHDQNGETVQDYGVARFNGEPLSPYLNMQRRLRLHDCLI